MLVKDGGAEVPAEIFTLALTKKHQNAFHKRASMLRACNVLHGILVKPHFSVDIIVCILVGWAAPDITPTYLMSLVNISHFCFTFIA